MNIGMKHRIAQRQVSAYLQRLPREDRELLSLFPRSIEEIAPLVFSTTFESISGLTERRAAQVLRERHRWEGEVATSDDRLLGLLVANDQRAVIFSNPDRGIASERFTRAHELGHLAIEHLPNLPHSEQQDLFDNVRRPVTISRRDDAYTIPMESEATLHPSPTPDLGRVQGELEERHREARANLFACELLAPIKQVAEFALPFLDESHGGDDELVAAFMSGFGLSRRTATILLGDLQIIQSRETTSFLL